MSTESAPSDKTTHKTPCLGKVTQQVPQNQHMPPPRALTAAAPQVVHRAAIPLQQLPWSSASKRKSEGVKG